MLCKLPSDELKSNLKRPSHRPRKELEKYSNHFHVEKLSTEQEIDARNMGAEVSPVREGRGTKVENGKAGPTHLLQTPEQGPKIKIENNNNNQTTKAQPRLNHKILTFSLYVKAKSEKRGM